jgi:hypothetical protein
MRTRQRRKTTPNNRLGAFPRRLHPPSHMMPPSLRTGPGWSSPAALPPLLYQVCVPLLGASTATSCPAMGSAPPAGVLFRAGRGRARRVAHPRVSGTPGTGFGRFPLGLFVRYNDARPERRPDSGSEPYRASDHRRVFHRLIPGLPNHLSALWAPCVFPFGNNALTMS